MVSEFQIRLVCLNSTSHCGKIRRRNPSTDNITVTAVQILYRCEIIAAVTNIDSVTVNVTET